MTALLRMTTSPDIYELRYLFTSSEEMTVKIMLNRIMLKEIEVSMSSSFFLLRNRLVKAML
ncbi:hypothetical protein D3C75_1158330 [compost metagenome]